MIELIFTACLASQPNVCDERSISFIDTTRSTCMMHAQPQLAQWINTHPDWTIARWTCQTGIERGIRA